MDLYAGNRRISFAAIRRVTEAATAAGPDGVFRVRYALQRRAQIGDAVTGLPATEVELLRALDDLLLELGLHPPTDPNTHPTPDPGGASPE